MVLPSSPAVADPIRTLACRDPAEIELEVPGQQTNRSRQLRRYATDAIRPKFEIRAGEFFLLDKLENGCIHHRSTRLDKIVDECLSVIAIMVHDPAAGIIALGNRIDMNLTSRDCVGVIQNRIDWMGGVSIVREPPSATGSPRSHSEPRLGYWMLPL